MPTIGSAAAALLLCIALPAQGYYRSPAMRAEFQRAHGCPATGQHRGACPGYHVDHIKPLKCGGADLPANMQWLTVDQHKDKTRREAQLCRHP